MSPSTFVVVTVLLLLGMAWYANSSKRDKILCTFKRVNKTEITKFVKMSSRYVISDGRRYDIVPQCCVLRWYNSGFIHMIFPQWVWKLDFTHTSRYPLDPNTLEPVIITPEVRNSMNKEEWVKSYAKGFTPPSQKKTSVLAGYLPWISIMLVILVGFWLYNNMSALAIQMQSLQNAFNAIAK